MTVTIRHGDCREVLQTMPDQSVHCCVTSPPYFGLRDYGVDGQIGLELTPELFVDEMVSVFREVRRVLRDDGTLWLNLGDSYTPVNRGENARPRRETMTGMQVGNPHADIPTRKEVIQGLARGGFKQKDLMGIPWMVAFALRADGWYLRQDIIWSKPNPMPESVTDRCTKAHEYIFLMSKSARYHYDAEAVAEAVTASTVERLSQPNLENQTGSARVPGKTNGNMKAVGRSARDSFKRNGSKREQPMVGQAMGTHRPDRPESAYSLETRNRRSVWTVPTQPFKEAHFATFPPELIEPCIKAGCPAGGVVLDPFGGAGTTGLVADRLCRDAILIELNPEYAAIADRRIRGDGGMFAEVQS
jgi:DNA modification methylase